MTSLSLGNRLPQAYSAQPKAMSKEIPAPKFSGVEIRHQFSERPKQFPHQLIFRVQPDSSHRKTWGQVTYPDPKTAQQNAKRPGRMVTDYSLASLDLSRLVAQAVDEDEMRVAGNEDRCEHELDMRSISVITRLAYWFAAKVSAPGGPINLQRELIKGRDKFSELLNLLRGNQNNPGFYPVPLDKLQDVVETTLPTITPVHQSALDTGWTPHPEALGAVDVTFYYA